MSLKVIEKIVPLADLPDFLAREGLEVAGSVHWVREGQIPGRRNSGQMVACLPVRPVAEQPLPPVYEPEEIEEEEE